MTLRPIILLLAALFVACGISAARASANDPGPSLDLFNNHYYHCKTDYYVAPGGSDSNPGTVSSPWKTLQGANNNLATTGSTAPGVCVRVAPGTYDGVELSVGGNIASAGGYVVYRCTTLDACTVKGDAGYHSAESFETVWPGGGRTPPNYIMVDGFVLSGGNIANNGVGVSIFNGDNGPELSAHHIWVLNSVVTGFGQAGVGIAAGEYFYIIHDKIYGNSNLGCGVQGSGISFNILHTVPNYTPTADDKTNPDKLLGPTWVEGKSFFHVVVEWNVVFNNALTQCGTQNNPTDTDGNGIIFDTNLEHFVNGVNQGNSENYDTPSLVAFNVLYNDGAGGFHAFYSANGVVANNSCYNNQLDPGDGGTSRPCMDDSDGYGFTFINNIAVAIPATYTGSCWPVSPPYAKYNYAMLGAPSQAPYDLFSNNITKIIGTTCNGSEVSVYNGDVYTCESGSGTKPPANQCATDPSWVNVGTQTVGTDTSPPIGVNFALKAGSPAIGTGLKKSWLPSTSVDVGACRSKLTTCP